ncbi:hypothetical protein WDV85_12110 [Pseudokineococcus sp. 5B2Z-1]|uniref:hypothetical protein n=1 Tax=Pseudokineococcus sp. 5B2Z-1 TaxID=3132744 RepID=UPI0030B5DC43
MSYVILGIDVVLGVASPFSFILSGEALVPLWWAFPLYGLVLAVCLTQALRGRGAWWLTAGLAIATTGSWLDSQVFDLDRTAGPALIPLVLLVLLVVGAVKRRRRRLA